MPDAISASAIAEVPGSGTTTMPARCAADTSAAPGSAMPGHPASDTSPTSLPASAGSSIVATAAIGVRAQRAGDGAQGGLPRAVVAVEQAQRGVEHDRPAADSAQQLECVRPIARLANGDTVARRELVGTDDQVGRMRRSNRAGFRL